VTVFSAGLAARPAQPERAEAFIDCLASPEAAVTVAQERGSNQGMRCRSCAPGSASWPVSNRFFSGKLRPASVIPIKQSTI
jgi:hypothetical protein